MGRNAEQNQQMLDARNEQILSAALELFATRGLAASRIKDIAARAGMSQGLVYHYYPSKEEIFVALIHNAFDKLNHAVVALEQMPLPPREKLQTAIEALLQGFQQTRKASWYHLLVAQASFSDAIPEKARAIIEQRGARPYLGIAEIIRQGQHDGSIGHGDPDQLAEVFWLMVKGVALHKAGRGDAFIAPDSAVLMKLFS